MSASSLVSIFRPTRLTSSRSQQSGEMQTDCSLLTMFVDGDQEAFAKLMQRHQTLVMSVCQRILREATDAEDAFQATFLVLARKAQSLQWQDSIAGWLYQTSRRTAMKLRSMNARRHQMEQRAARERNEASSLISQPDKSVTVGELAEILDQELERLPILFREVVLLTQVEGLSREETAQRLGITEAAVKDRLERGRGRLRSRLVRRGVTLSGTLLATWLLPGTAQAASATLVASTTKVAGAFATGSLVSGAVPTAVSLANGVLKIMGLEKVKFISACVLSMITAGGIAYGMLLDNPERFQKGLVGQIVDVQTGRAPASVTIQLEEFDTLLSLDVTSDVKVWMAYKASDLGSVLPGQFASLRLSSDHRTVNEIHVSGVQHEVAIHKLTDSGAMTVALLDEDDDEAPSKTHAYQLAPDVILRIGGLPATRSELTPGMEVPLELADDGKTIHAIEAEADPATVLVGAIMNVDAEAGTMSVQVEVDDDHEDGNENESMKTIVLNATSDVLIEVDGKKASLKEILPGSEVVVRTSDDQKTARAVRATSPETSDDDSE